MSKEGKWVMGVLMVFLVAVGFVSPAAAGTVPTPENWAPLVAKIIMGLSISLGLAGSAMGLSISFSALLGGGPDNYYKNIVVAMMPAGQISTQVRQRVQACRSMLRNIFTFLSHSAIGRYRPARQVPAGGLPKRRKRQQAPCGVKPQGLRAIADINTSQ